MHFRRSKSNQQDAKSNQKMMPLPNESMMSDASNTRDNIHDLSISTIDTPTESQTSKGAQFFGKLWASAVSAVKITPPRELITLTRSTSTDSQASPTPQSPYKRAAFNAKREADLLHLRIAKRVLREIHETRKEEAITRLIQSQQIQTEEEAQVIEDDMDTKYVEEYGSEGASDLEDEIMGSDELGENNVAKKPEYESVADVSSVDIRSSNYNNDRKLVTEGSSNKPNYFSIDEIPDDSRYLPTDPGVTKNSAKESIRRASLELVGVYYNQLSSTFLEQTWGIQTFFSREEEINMKRLKKYDANRNAFASGISTFLNRDLRQIFIHERNFYVARKTYGNFGVIEAAYPLSRLAKIYIHDKSKILKFSFVDDEDPNFETIDETFQVKNCSELVAEVQKNLQGINSSIRIHQSGYSFE